MSKYKLCIIIGLMIISHSSCKKNDTIYQPNKNIASKSNNAISRINYASGFDIQVFENYKKLIIKSPYPNATESITYILVQKGSKLPDLQDNETLIKVPIEKIVVTSTTHIPILEILNEENALVGFPNTDYISSPKTRALIASNKVKEIGKEQSLNTEILLDLQPELLVGFSMSGQNKMFSTIEKSGIPVVLNGDWLEKTPLGRAEWIKFFAVLFNKEKQADSIFKHIEKAYLNVKKIASQSKIKPKILSGVMYKDKWNLPAGDSYVAQLLKDANINYPWRNTSGSGSLSLSFESVIDKAKDANIWIGPGYFSSFKQLETSHPLYAKFDAFKTKNIYNFVNKKGETGGVLYYELAPIQPHIVLKDIIKIVHPELLTDYKSYYLERLDD
jgi:iron complex transport system substrate-binding protein